MISNPFISLLREQAAHLSWCLLSAHTRRCCKSSAIPCVDGETEAQKVEAICPTLPGMANGKVKIQSQVFPSLQHPPLSRCSVPWANAFASQSLGHLVCQMGLTGRQDGPGLTSCRFSQHWFAGAADAMTGGWVKGPAQIPS